MASPDPRTAVVYDTDMGSDDWLAALLLLCHPAVDVKAITVTGAGLARLDRGVANALTLAALAGRPAVEVAAGRDGPLEGGHPFPDEWRNASDTLPGEALPAGGTASGRSAVDAILAHDSAGALTVVATGPLTNLADALRADPGLAGRLARVYVMGGAVGVPGNVHATRPELANRTAEWNFYADPAAAAAVVASGAAVTLVPLDATDAVPVTPAFLARLRTRRTTPAARFVCDVLTSREGDVNAGRYYFWDALAAAVAIDERISPPAEMTIRVELQPDDEGRTVADPAGRPVRVCRGADLPAFERLFLDTLAPTGSE